MKKVILSSLAFVITLSQIGTINANALEMVDEIKENVNIENIEIENKRGCLQRKIHRLFPYLSIFLQHYYSFEQHFLIV